MEKALRRPDVAYCILKRTVESAPVADTKYLRDKLKLLWEQGPSFEPFLAVQNGATVEDRVAFSLHNGDSYPLSNALEKTSARLIGEDDPPFTPNIIGDITVCIEVRIDPPSPAVR